MTLRVAVLSVSDAVAGGMRDDLAGRAIGEWLIAGGHTLAGRATVPHDEDAIVAALEGWVEGGETDLILTAGGTGFSSRDVTPEATWAVIEREAPGIAEALRAAGSARSPATALSRGIAGIAQQVLIVNLPGAPESVTQGLAVLAPFTDFLAATLRDETEH